MDQMFIDDILCMDIFDNCLGERIADLGNSVPFFIEIDNALSGRESLAVTKLTPF